jgi:two-component system response regulator HydG
MRGRVLVVDDDRDTVEMTATQLRLAGFEAIVELDPLAVAARVAGGDAEAVLTDLRMAGADGLDVCARVSAARPDVPVIVVTGHASIDAAVGALRVGAFDFVVKPVEGEMLALALDRAVRHHRLTTELHRLRTVVAERGGTELVGDSEPARRLRELVARVAATQVTVLVTGASGTGKELVARALHAESPRRDGPFVAVHCAALPATLLESELFGHVRGAFTDARAARRGLFLEAQGGTLFLDEIGEMPLEMQAKLLRALQERTVRPVGGSDELPFDARVVAATNRDLAAAVREGRFRADLYYRIHVCAIEVPPLAARADDIPLLARTFLQRSAERHGKAVTAIAPAAMARLVGHTWPGNVRELAAAIERAVAMARFDQIVVDDLPDHIATGSRSLLPVRAVSVDQLVSAAELERRYVAHVLEVVHGNKSHAARILGFDRRTLYRKLSQAAELAAAPSASADTEGAA